MPAQKVAVKLPIPNAQSQKRLLRSEWARNSRETARIMMLHKATISGTSR